MHLLIVYVVYFSVLFNGQWLPQEHRGVIEVSSQTCQEGVHFYRQSLGAEDVYRFDAMDCSETYLDSNNERYARPE